MPIVAMTDKGLLHDSYGVSSKDKAWGIMHKFDALLPGFRKPCAIVVVEEIVKAIEELPINGPEEVKHSIDFWKDVRQQILID